MSRVLQVLTLLIGASLLACAVALLGYGTIGGEHLNDTGWVVLVLLSVAGVGCVLRAKNWGMPRLCPRCGESVARSLSVCPRCGMDLDAVWWSLIGKQKPS